MHLKKQEFQGKELSYCLIKKESPILWIVQSLKWH